MDALAEMNVRENVQMCRLQEEQEEIREVIRMQNINKSYQMGEQSLSVLTNVSDEYYRLYGCDG